MKKKERRTSVPMDVTESKDYKVVYATGVFGGLNPSEGKMIFFLDRLKPTVKKGGGSMELDRVNRELQVEVHLSPSHFISIAKWMSDHAQKLQKNAKPLKPGNEGKLSGTSYIG